MAEVHDQLPAHDAALRRRIAEIVDELAALPRTDFASRAPLHQERDALTALLRSRTTDPAISREWAARASQRPDAGVRPHIASHSEGGGSG